MTKISVITINLNNQGGLENTIKSVIFQNWDVEYIVIDGGSTDGSIEIIRKYADKIAYWISEKDNGVYNAMNKGIIKATGEYLLFLNSGDYLVDNIILSKSMGYNFDKDIIYGDLYLKYSGTDLILKKYPDKLSLDFFINNESLPHPSSFINRNLFKKVGFYNEEFSIVSDWEFWLKAIFLYQATYKRIPLPVAVFDMEGMSSTMTNFKHIQIEKEAIYAKYFAGIIEDYRKFHAERANINSNFFIRVLKKLKLLRYGF